jgi:putative ABC transport system permease protein
MTLSTLRSALRQLRRNPGYTIAAAGTLAVAVAACAGVFAAFEAVLVRPLPFADPASLALLWRRPATEPARRVRIAAPEAGLFASESRMLDGLAFVMPTRDAVLEAGGSGEHLRVERVSPDLFEVLGVRAVVGASLNDAYAAGPAGSVDAVAVLAHDTWERRFGSDPSAIGRIVRINGAPVRIAGVMPASLELPLPAGSGVATDADAWIALALPLVDLRRTDDQWQDQDSDNTGAVIVRLEPGVTTAQLEQELDAIAGAANARANAQSHVSATEYGDDIAETARPAFIAVLAAVLLVLLVASLNVTGLMIARAAGRRGEIRVRTALGASPGRILGLIFMETAILATIAIIVGLVMADWVIDVLRALAPAGLPGLADSRLDGRVILACTAALACTTILATILSALTLAADTDGLALRGRGIANPSRSRLRPALVIGQIALSIALLSAAGLLLRSLAALSAVHPGFDPGGLLTFDIAMPASIRGPAERSRVARDLADRIRELPSVRSVGLIGGLPLSGERFAQPWAGPGQLPDPDGNQIANFRVVSSDWFEASGTRLLAGRTFTRDEDIAEDDRVAIVDQRIARLVSSNGDAIDSFIAFPLDGRVVQARIVGIAESVRFESLAANGPPGLYVPYRQEASRQIGFAVRTRDDPASLESDIRVLLARFASATRPTAWNFRGMSTFIDEQTAPTRFAVFVTAAFASIALLLTILSLYALIAWFVAQRRAEIGVRIALGAAPARITARFTRDGIRLAAIGTAFGFVASAFLSRPIAGLLFATDRFDPAVYLTATLLVFIAATLASTLPARRASRLDPVRVLRSD